MESFARSKAAVQTVRRFEFEAEVLEISDATADARLPFQQTDANATVGEQSGCCQTTDTAADHNHFVILHRLVEEQAEIEDQGVHRFMPPRFEQCSEIRLQNN